MSLIKYVGPYRPGVIVRDQGVDIYCPYNTTVLVSDTLEATLLEQQPDIWDDGGDGAPEYVPPDPTHNVYVLASTDDPDVSEYLFDFTDTDSWEETSPGSGTFRPISTTEQTVWLQDPALAGGADNTGVSYVNDAFNAAIAQARALAPISNGKVKIHGEPGSYKWDTSKGGLAIPGGVEFTFGGGTPQAALLTFPAETGYPTAIAVCTAGSAANATTVALTNIKNTIPPATPSIPKPAMLGGTIMTYTGVTQVGTNATLTGCVGTPFTVGQSLFVAGCAVYVGGSVVRSYTLDKSVRVSGPSTGSSAWATATIPANAMDGIWVSDRAGIDCSVDAFRQGVMYAGNHETFGGSVYMDDNWCNYACESPYQYQWNTVNSGNQLWQAGAINSGRAWWCQHYISAGNALTGADFDRLRHEGNAPWWMWKAASSGVTGSTPLIMSDCTVESLCAEGLGLGLVGSADNLGQMTNVAFRGGNMIFHDNLIPSPATTPVAIFACSFDGLTVDHLDGIGFTGSTLSSGIPLFKSDLAIGRIHYRNGLATILTAHPPSGFTLVNPPYCDVEVDDGRLVSGFVNATTAGDVVAARTRVNPSVYPTCLVHERYDGTPRWPAGIAVAAEVGKIIHLATSKKAGWVTTNVRSRSTPPTGPAAVTSATAGTLPAATYYYKIAAMLSGGGETAASSEVSVALSGSNSASLSWTAPASPPHSQTIAGYRIYRGTSAGNETGYIYQAGVGTTYVDSGAALTTKAPGTTNVGCEVYFTGANHCFVRADSDGSTYYGRVRTATSAYDTASPVIGVAYGTPFGFGADNGTTVSVLISPALD